MFLFDFVWKIWVVRFIMVKFHFGARFSIRFTQESVLECPLYRGNFMRIWPENGRANFFVRFSQVSTLEHVLFRQVSLYFLSLPMESDWPWSTTYQSKKLLKISVTFSSHRLYFLKVSGHVGQLAKEGKFWIIKRISNLIGRASSHKLCWRI